MERKEGEKKKKKWGGGEMAKHEIKQKERTKQRGISKLQSTKSKITFSSNVPCWILFLIRPVRFSPLRPLPPPQPRPHTHNCNAPPPAPNTRTSTFVQRLILIYSDSPWYGLRGWLGVKDQVLTHLVIQRTIFGHTGLWSLPPSAHHHRANTP